MNSVEYFEKNKIIHLKEFLSKETCDHLTSILNNLVKDNITYKDEFCPLSESASGVLEFETLLNDLIPHFENVCGKQLLPTYSYARLYKPGEELQVHLDRPACEISATITIGFEGENWPICFGDADKKQYTEIPMEIGDAVLYRGCEVHHWREKYTQGKWQAQLFLHYVDKNGLHTDQHNQTPNNIPLTYEMREFVFTDVFTVETCDAIINKYFENKNLLNIEQSQIGNNKGFIDTSIRNVKRITIPTHNDIGARLAAAGFAANYHAWKFNITHANQAEILIYPKDGKYVSHIDTLLQHSDETRKLTVLAFLNDDFKGGKFYMMISNEKYYPPQSKGTVIVFPSFILHGVENIEEGERFSAVCWLAGPFFK